VRLFHIVALTLLGAFVVAAWFLFVFHWTLPQYDGAYRRPPGPVELEVMFVGASLSAGVLCPFALALLWRADLWRSFSLVLVVALVAVTAITPFASIRAWPASVALTVLAMAACRWLFRQSSSTNSPAPPAPGSPPAPAPDRR
jgi:hypothetical protein